MPKVTVETFENVAVITLDNPDARNALTIEMAKQLFAACDEIDANRALGATVVRGAGGTFCSGSDTKAWSADLLSDDAYARAGLVYDSFQRLGRLETPTVAAVRGAAVGAGLNLVLATDVRLIADDAKLIAGFLRMGLHPGGGFWTLLGRTTTRNTTAAVGLFGETLSGPDAVRIGLAWEALPDAEVEARAMELAERAARDPLVARQAAASMRRELGPPAIPWEVAAAAERSSQLWTTHRLMQARAAHED